MSVLEEFEASNPHLTELQEEIADLQRKIIRMAQGGEKILEQRDALAEALRKIMRDGDYTAPEGMTRIAEEALRLCGFL